MRIPTTITSGQLAAFLNDIPKDSKLVLDIPDNVEKLEPVNYVHFRKTLFPDGTVGSEVIIGFVDPNKKAEAPIVDDLPF